MRLLFTVLATLILSTPTHAGYSTVARSVRALQAPNVNEFGISALRNICTVTSINQTQHYWLTAAHCVGAPELYVANRRADVVFVDTVADLAVLYTEGYSLPALRLRPTSPIVGQHVMLVGFPLGLPSVQVFWGRISSLRTEVDNASYTLFDLQACGGNSGSSIVDANNQVVSVLQIGFGQGCSGFSGGAPWRVVRALVGGYFGK